MDDRDMLIRTVIGEAGNQDSRGKQAVASVVLNRVKSGWGKSVKDVVTAPHQFEPWGRADARARMLSVSPDSQEYRDAAAAVDAAFAGDDPTGGATHFLNPAIVRKRRRGSLPGWASATDQTAQIGDHTFYRPMGRMGGTLAAPVADMMQLASLRGGDDGRGGGGGGGDPLASEAAQQGSAAAQLLGLGQQMPTMDGPPQSVGLPPGGLPQGEPPAGGALGGIGSLGGGATPPGTFGGSPTAPWAGEPDQLDVRALLGDYLRQQKRRSFFDALGRIGASIGKGDPWGYAVASGAQQAAPEGLGFRDMLGLAQIQEGQGRERRGRQALAGSKINPDAPDWLQQEEWKRQNPGPAEFKTASPGSWILGPDGEPQFQVPENAKAPDYEGFALPDGTVQKTRYVPGAPDVGFGPDTVPVGKPGKPGASTAVTINNDLTKSTTTGLQGKVLSGRDQIARLNVIKSEFRPQWAEFAPRAGLAWSSFKDKIGSLDPAKRAELAAFTTWRSDSFDHLNQILKDMAGTAVTPNEMERQLRALPNPGEGIFDGDGPTEYQAKLEAASKRITNAVYRYNYALKHGLNPLSTGTAMDENLDAVPAFIESVGAQIEEQVKAESPGLPQEAIDAEVAARLQREFGVE